MHAKSDPLMLSLSSIVPTRPLSIGRELELNDCTVRGTRRCPNSTAVVLDDRTADGKTHPHAMFFGRKQWLEDFVGVGRINSNPGIRDRDMHDIRLAEAGSYAQPARLR